MWFIETDTSAHHSGRLSFLSTSHQPFTSSPTLATSPSSLFSEHFEASKPENPQTVSRFRLKTTFPLPKRRLLDPNPKSNASPPKMKRNTSEMSSDSTNVSSCHICHRRPTTVQDLPSFTDCEACGLRTCFVCIRACESPRCHQPCVDNELISTSSSFTRERRGKRVCGNCCTEVGVEGTVWCLVCYEDDEDEERNPLKNRDKKELHDESVQKVSGWLQGCGQDDV